MLQYHFHPSAFLFAVFLECLCCTDVTTRRCFGVGEVCFLAEMFTTSAVHVMNTVMGEKTVCLCFHVISGDLFFVLRLVVCCWPR